MIGKSWLFSPGDQQKTPSVHALHHKKDSRQNKRPEII